MAGDFDRELLRVFLLGDFSSSDSSSESTFLDFLVEVFFLAGDLDREGDLLVDVFLPLLAGEELLPLCLSDVALLAGCLAVFSFSKNRLASLVVSSDAEASKIGEAAPLLRSFRVVAAKSETNESFQ